ncbi:MAG: 2-oxoacid:acceptor oxidoreductase family protein, partial [Thermoguttaceae bacterium]|nr:2-oxoacid:acceptor oxidoreductase family protein [Thermoguttaceae bacterium]
NARAANTILLGVMSNVLHFPEENWKESIRSCVKPKFVDVNIKAFEIGRAMK